MRKVRFTSSSGPNWPWVRQFPQQKPVWGNTHFVLDSFTPTEDDATWLVVYDGFLSEQLITNVPIARRIFMAGEPESFYAYQKDFLAQFGTVLTTQTHTAHPNVIFTQPAVNWFAGVRYQAHGEPGLPILNFESLSQPFPKKSKLCSVISSDKSDTPGHRQRKAFVDRLMSELGDRIDFYGRGIHPIADKDTALADYAFHIAIENSQHPHYWTEKLADPFLRGCMPIYHGCPNTIDYFPAEALIPIDIEQPDEAIEQIRQALEQGISSQQSAAIAQARELVLHKYNVFAYLDELINALDSSQSNTSFSEVSSVLRRDEYFKKRNRIQYRLLRAVGIDRV